MAGLSNPHGHSCFAMKGIFTESHLEYIWIRCLYTAVGLSSSSNVSTFSVFIDRHLGGLLKIEVRVLGKCSITELCSQPSLHLSIDLYIHRKCLTEALLSAVHSEHRVLGSL